jgi:FkbM family methyltransferase
MTPFISYAQNLEDVMLYRALRDVESGFYIDVGAHHPVADSVTKAFYDRGWRGINIEPATEYFQLLERDRPDDINLNVLVGSNTESADFHEVVGTGLSTVIEHYARGHAAGGYEVRTRRVSSTTLDAICLERGVQDVHFLKIDVEGAEREVLRGFGFRLVRPWIVLVEANEPGSTRDVSSEWQALLTDKEYREVYHDGLNRYYTANEHGNLADSFRVPPNIFDHYISYPHWSCMKTIEVVTRELARRGTDEMEMERLRSETDSLRTKIRSLYGQLDALENALRQVSLSYSWRITSPLRFLAMKLGHGKTTNRNREK